jgi:hypothetical protein
MDLFEQLSMSIGGQSVADHMDSLRVTNDARAIEALHEPAEPELKDYGVTVELTLSAFSEEEAKELAAYLMEYGVLPGKAPVGAGSNTFWDIERVIEL